MLQIISHLVDYNSLKKLLKFTLDLLYLIVFSLKMLILLILLVTIFYDSMHSEVADKFLFAVDY